MVYPLGKWLPLVGYLHIRQQPKQTVPAHKELMQPGNTSKAVFSVILVIVSFTNYSDAKMVGLKGTGNTLNSVFDIPVLWYLLKQITWIFGLMSPQLLWYSLERSVNVE